jgi:hypothetical protein
MNRSALCAVTLLALAFSAHEAFALPYSDGFNGGKTFTTSMLDTAPPGWLTNLGTVDWINKANTFGVSATPLLCFNKSRGCVDLDGTTYHSGVFETASPFHLLKNQAYELSAEVSGNFRTTTPNNLEFGFLKGTLLTGIQKATTVSGIAEFSPFTLYTLFFTPSANMNARAFFYDVLGTNNQGPILDNVKVTAVPLPAAAWLMLSGLAALGAVARRRISGTAA